MTAPAATSLRSSLARFASIASGERFCTVVLCIAVAAWIAYRMVMRTSLGIPLAESPVITADFVRHRIIVLLFYCEVCHIWREGYGKRDAAALAVYCLMAWGLYSNGYLDSLYDASVVFVARHADFRKLLAFATIVVAIVLTVVVLCTAAGIAQDYVIAQGSRIRHCLGFAYCLFPSQYLFAITCASCILLDRKMHPALFGALAAVNVAFFALTDARLSFGLSMLALAVTALRKAPVPEKAWRALAKASSWSFVAVAVASIAVTALYAAQAAVGAEWLDGLNE